MVDANIRVDTENRNDESLNPVKNGGVENKSRQNENDSKDAFVFLHVPTFVKGHDTKQPGLETTSTWAILIQRHPYTPLPMDLCEHMLHACALASLTIDLLPK